MTPDEYWLKITMRLMADVMDIWLAALVQDKRLPKPRYVRVWS